jgi:hypothetical protein
MLIAAFGGGILGANVSGVAAFVIVGFIALASGMVGLVSGSLSLSGAAEYYPYLTNGADFMMGNMAFGSYIGPHVAFAGAVAAAAYAANKSKTLDSGMSITTPIFSLNDPIAMLVGGVFGVLGFLILHLYANVLAIPTDNVALTVATSCIISRFVFGKSGLFGKYTPPAGNPNAPRQWIPSGNALANILILGFGVGLMVSAVGIHLMESGVVAVPYVQAFYPPLIFGLAAISLVFAVMGKGVAATHHIALPAALAAVLSGNLVVGVVVGTVNSLLNEIVGKALNEHSDTFIDPPAVVIFSSTFVILAMWG